MRRMSALAIAAALAVGSAPAIAKSKKSEVQCKDGSTSKGGRGACSGHGGIARGGQPELAPIPDANVGAPPEIQYGTKPGKAKSSPGKDKAVQEGREKSGALTDRQSGDSSQARSAPTRSRSSSSPNGSPTARCKDGTLSYAQHHSGACSNHGGVDRWLDK